MDNRLIKANVFFTWERFNKNQSGNRCQCRLPLHNLWNRLIRGA
jgi:hypothetical protein